MSATGGGQGAPRRLRIAYLMSRFPKATETFILYEILELERLGHEITILPLVTERAELVQPGGEPLLARVRPFRPLSRETLGAQLHWLRRRPRAYLGAWWTAIAGTFRSPRVLARSLVVVPWAARVAQAVEAGSIDHVHAHWATHPALAAMLAGRLTGVPYSFTAHAHDLFVQQSLLREKLAESAFTVTISEFNRRFLENRYGPLAARRVTVIHCGADPTVFAADAARPAPAAGDGVLRLAVVASLQPQKGHVVLVDALGRLRDRGVAFEAVFVGDGPERPAVERRLRELGLVGRVRLAGTLPRDRVAAELARADVVVQPSIVLPSGKTEGIPVALMEALAAGCAAVASDVSGIPELVIDGETGLLVPPGDAGALAGALARLAADPALRARLGQAGRALVLRDFDLRRNAQQLAARIEAAHGAPS